MYRESPSFIWCLCQDLILSVLLVLLLSGYHSASIASFASLLDLLFAALLYPLLMLV